MGTGEALTKFSCSGFMSFPSPSGSSSCSFKQHAWACVMCRLMLACIWALEGHKLASVAVEVCTGYIQHQTGLINGTNC